MLPVETPSQRAERLAREKRLVEGEAAAEAERAKTLAALDRPEDYRADGIARNLGIPKVDGYAIARSSFAMAPAPEPQQETFYGVQEKFGFPTRQSDIDKAPWARGKSIYADIFDEYAARNPDRFRQTPEDQTSILNNAKRNLSIEEAIKANPDEEARIKDLANKLQLPPAMVRAIGISEANNRLLKEQARRIGNDAPATLRILTDQDRAKIAIDDFNALSSVERTLRETFAGSEITANQTAINKLSKKMTDGVPLKPSEMFEYERLKARNDLLQRQRQMTDNGVTWFTNTIAEGATDFALGLPEMATYGAAGAVVGLLGGPGGAVTSARIGAGVGQFTYNFDQIVGYSFEDYKDFRDDLGRLIDQDAARGAAYVNAVLSVGLEVAGERALMKTVPGLDKLVGGKDVVKSLLQTQAGRNVMLRIGKKVATGAIMEGVTEGLQQLTQIYTGEVLKIVAPGEFAPITTEEVVSQALQATAAGAVGSLGIVVPGATAQVLIENRELRKADIELTTSEGTVNRIEAAIAATAETKLVSRDRGELERFIDEAAADSPVSTIYLSAEDLASVATTAGLEPRQLAQQLGVADQIQTSATTGSLLEMPIGKFIATVAGTDLAAPLTQVIKTNPFLLNRMEQEAFASSGRADIIAEADRLVQEALTDETFAAEAQSIQSEVLQQFRAIEGGEVFTPEVSRAYSTITTQTYVSLARRLGISPREAYERYQRFPLKIERQAGPVEGVGQPVMEQAQGKGSLIEADAISRIASGAIVPTSAELDDALNALREAEFSDLVRQFGGDRQKAEKFRSLWRQAENAPTRQEADMLDAQRQALIEGMPDIAPQEFADEYALRQLRDAFREIESGNAVGALTDSMTDLPTLQEVQDGKISSRAQAALAILRKATQEANLQGSDPAQMLDAALENYGRRFSDPADAEFMVGEVKKLVAAFAALKSRGVDVPELAESDQRAAGQDAVQGAGPREARDTEESLGQTKRNLDALGFYSAVQEAALRVPDGIWQLGWNAARNAIAKGRGGVPPRRTEMEYLGLDAMFGDTKLKGAALKDAVMEHIAAKRLSLVENFARFDPNVKAPTKAVMLDELSDSALVSVLHVTTHSFGDTKGRIITGLLSREGEFNTGMYIKPIDAEVSDDPVKRYDMPIRRYNLYRGVDLAEKRELIATGTIAELRAKAARIIVNENRARVLRNASKENIEYYWEDERVEAGGLVRGPGDIRLPGEDVPLFEAVIGLPKGVPGADYRAPVSHVGGKAKGTLVTAHGEERIDDKGQRTVFVGQVQSDMAQGAREVKITQEAQKRSLELIIQRSGIVDRATAAAWMKSTGSTDAGIAQLNDADLIGYARQRWANINGGYSYNYASLAYLSERDSNILEALDAPLLSTSEWTNVAVRAMIYRAAREGFQSISFPTGQTSEIIQGNDSAAQHYETNVKGALEKIGKQLGGEVRKGDVRYQDDEWAVFEDDVPFANIFNSAESAEGFAAERREYDSRSDVEVRNIGVASAYILDITPEMREKILSEGFPLFQERRGEYVPDLNTIRLLPKADWSSYLHEMGHHFLEVYNTAALQIEKMPEADRTPDEQKIVDDMRILLTDMARQANVQIVGDVLQWWASTPLAGRRPVHEKYAEATEKYFMEGKAPVPELQALFDRFKTWLLDVYKNLTALKVELTPEVRGVMDRMYAAHETVRTAEYNRKLVALFREKPEAMTDQEWTAYQQIAAQATSDAQDDLTARSLRDMQWVSGAKARVLRDMQRDNADKRKLVRAEVAAEVMAKPVNIVRSFLRRGIAPNGEPVTGPHKLNIDLLKARYPDVSGVDWKRLGYGQYGMLAKDGLDPDMAAEMLGYPSGEAMVRDLLAAGPAEPEIDAETDRRMLERFGDLNDEVKMSKAADEVIHSAMRAKVLQAEYAALIKASKQTKPLVIAAKEIAREIVGRQLASKLNLNKYLAAERAAGRKAEAAMRSGDFAAAASAKRDQLLNFEVVREAQRVLKERDKALDLFSRINKAKRETVAKTRNYDLVQAARAVLAAYGFGSVKNQPMDYMSAVKAYDPALYSALEPTIIAAVTAGKTLDQLTVTEFMGLRDTVRQFWDLSRQEMKVDIEGRQLDLEDIVQDLNGQLAAQGAAPKGPSTEAPTEWQKRLRQFAGLKASMRRVETWARLFDRGKAGAFTRFIWRPVSEAADRYRADRNKYVIRFRELFRAIEPTMSAGKINAPEINYTFKNKSELLHAILHTGNGSNYRKLLLGRGWGSEDQDGNLIDNAWVNLINRLSQEGVLNKADFDFAQSVWDLLEEIKPLAQATHKKVFGSYFAEITAEAVQTPFGTYKGGYVPAVYDTYNVQDAALRAQQDQVEANDSTMFPSPASGFTKSRVEYNRELALDLMIMSSHIDKVLKFAHLASPVRDVLKILRNKSFSAMLESVDPTAQSDMLLPWLTRAARQITEEPTKGQGGPMVDGFFRAIRQRSGMGLMFANVVNVAQQVTGFSVAALTVKPKYLASGLIRYIRNPIDLTRTIRQASPMMADRGDNQLASMYGEIDKIIDKNDKYGQARDWFGRHTYFMQQGVQNVMDVIVWAGAYDQALAEGSTETEAARQGDAAVRQTQGSTFAEDVSRIETGPAVLRSFVHMYGYFNMWGNLLSTEMRTAVSELGLKKGAGRLMFVYMAGFAIPALLAQLIADGLRGQLPEDEDDDGWLDEWMSWFFGTQAKTTLAFAPIVGQAGTAAIGAFTSVPYDDRVGGSPAISAIEAAVRTPASVYEAVAEDGDKSKAVKDTLTLMTTLTGLPFQAISRPVGYAVDVAEGDITPTSVEDYIRGLVTGSASQASR